MFSYTIIKNIAKFWWGSDVPSVTQTYISVNLRSASWMHSKKTGIFLFLITSAIIKRFVKTLKIHFYISEFAISERSAFIFHKNFPPVWCCTFKSYPGVVISTKIKSLDSSTIMAYGSSYSTKWEKVGTVRIEYKSIIILTPSWIAFLSLAWVHKLLCTWSVSGARFIVERWHH